MTLDECETIFDRALASESESEFCRVIEPLFCEYEILSLQFGRGSIFWRARLIESEEYSNISQLDYPPSECAKRGRLNEAGSSCFYISARKETALVEVGAQDNQFVQLAGFRIVKESPIQLVVIGEYANVQKNGYMHFAGHDPDMAITKVLNAMPRQVALKKIYIDKFFAHVLADPHASENGYMFSRALGEAIYARNKSEGIVFPSVKDRGGFNIAIKAAPSDRCFHNVSCLVTQITKVRRFGVIDFSIAKSAKYLDGDGNFVWLEGRTPETIGVYNMSKEERDAVSPDPNDRNNLLHMLHLSRNRQQSPRKI